MTKGKCSVCGKEMDEIYLTTECPECYEKGALKERKKEQDRIIKIIDKWLKKYAPGKVGEELKKEIKEK